MSGSDSDQSETPTPARSECLFYHSMDFPDGESVAGVWDIRGQFDQYIGNYPISGKTVLDVGTASGFLEVIKNGFWFARRKYASNVECRCNH
jgi:hypothetical protein